MSCSMEKKDKPQILSLQSTFHASLSLTGGIKIETCRENRLNAVYFISIRSYYSSLRLHFVLQPSFYYSPNTSILIHH